ncbi:hypothetical protein MN608_10356 [Microdochium nivale]|nr:hypothetical protein MN608_10356 [Microdochium nivale]
MPFPGTRPIPCMPVVHAISYASQAPSCASRVSKTRPWSAPGQPLQPIPVEQMSTQFQQETHRRQLHCPCASGDGGSIRSSPPGTTVELWLASDIGQKKVHSIKIGGLSGEDLT